jgi:hypothetical protein
MQTGFVVIPRKNGVAAADEPIEVWPLVEAALAVVEADPATFEAARRAIQWSDGCVILANYLNSEAKRVHRMDYRFKAPLLVLAADLARIDKAADSFYCSGEGCIYFETDDAQYSFHVFKDWTVDWHAVADDAGDGYEWTGEEQQTWALERLLEFLDDDSA